MQILPETLWPIVFQIPVRHNGSMRGSAVFVLKISIKFETLPRSSVSNSLLNLYQELIQISFCERVLKISPTRWLNVSKVKVLLY